MHRCCLSVCLSVCRQNAKKTPFSLKVSNLELWSLVTTYRKSYMNFSKNPLLDPKIQDGWDPPSCWGWSDLDKISETGAEWHVDCGDTAEIENRCRIPIWQTLGRITRHVILEPPATLQGAATWWIHCHDSRATYHIAGCSHLAKSMPWSCHIAGCNKSIRHIKNRFSPFFYFCLKV